MTADAFRGDPRRPSGTYGHLGLGRCSHPFHRVVWELPLGSVTAGTDPRGDPGFGLPSRWPMPQSGWRKLSTVPGGGVPDSRLPVANGSAESYLGRPMQFQNVRLQAFGYTLPEAQVTSQELEARIAPLYARLGLSEGRLELMSGIRERRFWPQGTRPSTVAAVAGERALAASGIPRDRIGLLIHSAVCRDFMEPATASVVHARLGLAPTAQALDLSNACLGFVNAMVQAACLLDAGHLEAALIVAGEDGGPLVEQTLQYLNQTEGVGRNQLKSAFSSLTIGSGAVAAVLVRDTSGTGHRLVGATARSATQHHELCSGGQGEHGPGPLMETDSEALLAAGIALAKETFAAFCAEQGCSAQTIDRFITHQVGNAHRRLLLAELGIEAGRDFVTFPELGNVGSVSLPITLAKAAEAGFVVEGQRVALLGIGSGLACQMLDLRW